jgi:hypothetical protein
VLGKGWNSDLGIHHMFFRFSPLTTRTLQLAIEDNAMPYAFFTALRPKADHLTSRPRGPNLKPP